MKENPQLIPEKNLLPFVTSPDGSYNLCHFWSNFEIGNLNFFRSKAYQMYFEYLDRYRACHCDVQYKFWHDSCALECSKLKQVQSKGSSSKYRNRCQSARLESPFMTMPMWSLRSLKALRYWYWFSKMAKSSTNHVYLLLLLQPSKQQFLLVDRQGGFYLERWGDAPVHSLAVAMLLNSSEVIFIAQDLQYHASLCNATSDQIDGKLLHTGSHPSWYLLLRDSASMIYAEL